MKKTITFTVIAILLIFTYVYVQSNKYKYIEPIATLQGEWIEVDHDGRAIKQIEYGNGVYVGIVDNLLGYSTNAIDWDFVNHALQSSTYMHDIIFAQGMFVAVADKQIMSSTNGQI